MFINPSSITTSTLLHSLSNFSYFKKNLKKKFKIKKKFQLNFALNNKMEIAAIHLEFFFFFSRKLKKKTHSHLTVIEVTSKNVRY